MSYPKLNVYKKKLSHNIKRLKEIFDEAGIQLVCVTKVFCADSSITPIYVEAGVETLGDSRIENLAKMKNLGIKRLLLRLPMISEAKEVVEHADISLNSELKTIRALAEAAKEAGKVHQIILMKDMGDLREGIFNEEDFLEAVAEIIKFSSIQLFGIGVNLTCYGGVIPDEQNLGGLLDMKKKAEQKFNIQIPIVSGGNSSSFYLLRDGRLPQGINQLRLGEAVVLGREAAYGEKIEGLYQDAFTLEAEIIELKEKPSIPIGQIGMDAFGNHPVFEDKGIRKRAIVAVGRQDAFASEMVPICSEIKILGQSSDHTILDVTEVITPLAVGDTVSFHLTYGSLLTLCTSQYVKKEMIE